jgi:hypothetical protein
MTTEGITATMRHRRAVIVVGVMASLVRPAPAAAQVPLAPVRASGQSATPVFEGWYRNPDGTYSLSFGYFNRNSAEILEIPIGPDNFIAPGDSNQGQPTQFQPRRHWGVFAVKVPADFGKQTIVWTLRVRGETFAIPGRLHPDWQIDALEGEAGTGNTPPTVRFEESGPEGRGPGGIAVGPRPATVGTPLAITAWVKDDGKASASIATDGRAGTPVTLTWFKHQGPGDVSFAPPTFRVSATGGAATTNVTFNKPGVYVLRLRVNDASGVTGAGHAQCCWTNGFVQVTVTDRR